MLSRRFAAALLAALVAAGTLTGCGADSWESKCTTNADLVVECTPEQRPAARAVGGELLDGGAYEVTRDRGKVVVVNFWGSWCNPCRAEADDLEKTFQATKAKGVSFVGVNIRDDKDSARAFERGRVTYPSVFDPDSKVALKFEVALTSPPWTLVLDRQGRIAAALRRAVVQTELQPIVERLAAEEPG